MSELRILWVATLLAATMAAAQAPSLQDPTRPYRPGPAAAPGPEGPAALELTAVLISASRRVAVVNGELYREGDRINGDVIAGIEPGAIRLKRGGEDVVVRLRKQGAAVNGEVGQ